MITIENHGPLITATDYWESPHAAAGKIYLSPNAGVIRVLIPRSRVPLIQEVRPAEYAILSLGPWPEERLPLGIEILWEDHSDNPYALHLSPESCAMVPGEPDAGQEWTISVWN